MKTILICTLIVALPNLFFLSADQPIMNEVPRWDGGYGFQVFSESRSSKDLKFHNNKLDNPNNNHYRKHITHLEGVYTWTKWIRLTVKIPWVQQSKKLLNVEESNQGFSDIKLALPLRHYYNEDGYSGHYGIVPQIRFGGDNKGLHKISDGSTDPGFSFTFEKETANLKLSADVTYWIETHSQKDDEWSIDTTLGWNYHDRGALKLETELVNTDQNEWIGMGPTFFWNFNDCMMTRFEYKFALKDTLKKVGLARGDSLRIGLGFVF